MIEKATSSAADWSAMEYPDLAFQPVAEGGVQLVVKFLQSVLNAVGFKLEGVAHLFKNVNSDFHC